MRQALKNSVVTLCGGGNTSHGTIAVLGSRGFKCNLFTRRPQDWATHVTATTDNSPWQHKGDIVGPIHKISSNAADLAEDTKFWILGGPVQSQVPILEQISEHITPNSYVGTMFGSGGFDWKCMSILGKERMIKDNITIFALFNVPWLCYHSIYGKQVKLVGPKDYLTVACWPKANRPQLDLKLETYYDQAVIPAPNFLTMTLTPSNQIIHPARLYSVFKDWDGKTPFKPEEIPLFYEDMDDFAASLLQVLDNELQSIKKGILDIDPTIDLSLCLPIKERICRQYGNQVKDKSTLRSVFRTNTGYATVKIPVSPVEGGVVLNTKARTFWEDVPQGLCVMRQLADYLGLQVPATNKMIEWHQKFMDREYLIDGQLNKDLIHETGCPEKYGFMNIQDVIAAVHAK